MFDHGYYRQTGYYHRRLVYLPIKYELWHKQIHQEVIAIEIWVQMC